MLKENIEVATIKPETSFSIEDSNYRLIEFIDEMKLDSLIDNLRNFMATTNGLGKTEQQKDIDYVNAQGYWKSFQSELRTVKFNFHLDRSQYTLLTDILLKKFDKKEYNKKLYKFLTSD